ncbi:MAG: NHL repeat-containing protein, partial [Deltaproteobacteria bacterium]|nr:NHL repeat-containing protein [Deltaproteobacteria bacterium]
CVDPDGEGPLVAGDGQFGKVWYGPGQYGIAFDSNAKRLYVADTMNSRVQAFGPDGTFLFKLGERGTVPGKFYYQLDVAVDRRNGRLVVLDSNAHRVQVFAAPAPGAPPELVFGSRCDLYGRYYPDGDPSCQVHPGTGERGNGQFHEPGGAAVDGQGRIWVVDTVNWRVQVFDEAGNFLFKFGEHGTGPGKFEYPVGIGIDAAGYAYVADASGYVQKFDPSGRYVTEISTAGYGVAVNRATGTIYVAARDHVSIWRSMVAESTDAQSGAGVHAAGDVATTTAVSAGDGLAATVTSRSEGGSTAVRFVLSEEQDALLCAGGCVISDSGAPVDTVRTTGSVTYSAIVTLGPNETRLFSLRAAGTKGQQQVPICHHPPGKPGKKQSITVGAPALKAHLAHGDSLGPCPK